MSGSQAKVGGGSPGVGMPSSSRRPGVLPRAQWVSSSPSPEEVDALIRRFPEVVQLPVEEVCGEEDRWAAQAVVLKSLGRRVAVEAVARELRLRAGMKGEVQVFGLGLDHLVARFGCVEDREKVFNRPWVVSGQLLAVERWRPRFRPSPEAISTALVWLRLPLLPVELWGPESLRAIARFAGEFVAIDGWTLSRNRGSFAKVAVRVELSKPLRPGVVVGGPSGEQWQAFVYENAGAVCLRCGCFHSAGASCAASEPLLRPENVAGDDDEAGGVTAFGSWLFAVRQWLPRPEVGGAKGVQAAAASGLGSSRSEGSSEGRSGGSPDAAGWSKPSKIARRISPIRATSDGRAVLLPEGRFDPLCAVPDEAGTGSLQLEGSEGLVLDKCRGKGLSVSFQEGRGSARGKQVILSLDRGKAKVGSGSAKTKRPRSPAQVMDRGVLAVAKTHASGSESCKGKGKQGLASGKLRSGPPTRVLLDSPTEGEAGQMFVFSAADSLTGSALRDSIASDTSIGKAVPHEGVVGKLKQALQADADGSLHQMVEDAGLVVDAQGEGSLGPDSARLSSSV